MFFLIDFLPIETKRLQIFLAYKVIMVGKIICITILRESRIIIQRYRDKGTSQLQSKCEESKSYVLEHLEQFVASCQKKP